MTGRKQFKAYLLLPFVYMASTVFASDGSIGQRLHEEHCMRCHDTSMYTRANRIVNNFPELKERIKQCELSNELAWFDEEIDAVATYLNSNYYHFEKR